MPEGPAAVVVEFTGLPGAGKTTLAAHTRAALIARGMPCSIADATVSAGVAVPTRAARRAGWAAAELAAHPRRGAAAVVGIHETAPASARDGLAGTIQWLAVQSLVARARRRPGVHLVEEGPLQTLWTLGLRAGEDVVSGVLPGLAGQARADLVIVVEAPLALLSARLDGRSSRHSRTQLLLEAERVAELVRGRELLDRVLGLASGEHLRLVNDGRERAVDLGRRAAEWVLRTAEGYPGVGFDGPEHIDE